MESVMSLLKFHFNSLSLVQKMLLLTSLVAAFIFALLIPWRPYTNAIILKWLPVGALSFFALCNPVSRQVLLFSASIFCHSIGDLLLEIHPMFYLLPAMLAFGLGHLGYSMVFLQNKSKPIQISLKRKILLSILVIFTLGMLGILITKIPSNKLIPIILYLTIITSMAIASILSRLGKTVICGALLYIISDSIIAMNIFIYNIPFAGYLICPTYYIGQLLIILGFLTKKSQI